MNNGVPDVDNILNNKRFFTIVGVLGNNPKLSVAFNMSWLFSGLDLD